MPCYTVTTTSVQWTANTNADLLFSALQGMNLSPRRAGQTIYFTGGNYNAATHELSLQSNSEERNQAQAKTIRATYAAAVVKDQFTRAGFAVQQTNAPKTIIMQRR